MNGGERLASRLGHFTPGAQSTKGWMDSHNGLDVLIIQPVVYSLFRLSHCISYCSLFPPSGPTAPSGPGPPHYRGFTITLRHTTVGRTPLDE
jgi:hypothetical protein